MLPTKFLTGSQTIDLVAQGHVGLEQVIADHQSRYAQRADILRAWTAVRHEEARRESGRPMVSGSELPLRGMIIGVKYIISPCTTPSPH